MTLFDTAIAAIRAGSIDASFRAVVELPDDLDAQRMFDEPLQLLCGPAHPPAASSSVTLPELAGHRIWMPGVVSGTEWGAYYAAFTAAFGLSIEPDARVSPFAGLAPGQRTPRARPAARPPEPGHPGRRHLATRLGELDVGARVAGDRGG